MIKGFCMVRGPFGHYRDGMILQVIKKRFKKYYLVEYTPEVLIDTGNVKSIIALFPAKEVIFLDNDI